MRRFYAYLENNIVVSIYDTPIKYETENYVEISTFDTNLIGATYKKDTNEFVRTK